MMRELTMGEIEQFDFTGRVPELHVSGQSVQTKAASQRSSRQNVLSFSAYPEKRRRSKLGTTRPA